MKKIVLSFVALLSMTMTYAGTTNTNSNEAMYAMNVNNGSLSRSLALTEDQAEAVELITARFAYDMKKAGKADESVRQEKVRKAVKRNLGQLAYVLDRDQYKKYRAILNATFVNRGITMG